MSTHAAKTYLGSVATIVVLACLTAACFSPPASAQALSFGQIRPFVVGFIPVVGRNGAVGGVLIDAEGVVARAELAEQARLREKLEAALQPLSADLRRASSLRKISLRRLEEAIAAHLAEKKPLTDEMNCLAGLQHVRYVFVYPAERDIVVAGPAEGWRLTASGDLVGDATGRPVMLLEDLLVALRSTEAARSEILCSIDPTEEGLARLRRLLRAGTATSPSYVRRMEQALGPQRIAIEGVPRDSHFARVMVSADVLMKRLAMQFEPSPVDGLPSYLQLAAAAGATPQTAMPRWWLAPDYEPLLHDRDRLAWEVPGRGVKAMSDDGEGSRRNSRTQQWADLFTKRYGELSAQLPVFAELQNCMDLAVVAALIAKEELLAASGFPMDLLLDARRLPTGGYAAPQTIASQASTAPLPRGWLVSVSGGVEMDPWRIADQAQPGATLAAVRTKAAPIAEPRWWWD